MTTALLDACQDLHASYEHGSTSSELIARVFAADAQLQSEVAALLRERDKQAQAKRLMQGAHEAHTRLLRLATRMQAAQVRLAGSIERSRQALAAADEAQASGRHVPLSTMIEYAERVSYSNAAPCGPTAFAGAGRNMFYHGWGTPAPLQHMAAASRFANADDPAMAAEVEQPSEPAASAQPAAPAFIAVSAQQGAASAERSRVSLSFGDSDEEDDDF